MVNLLTLSLAAGGQGYSGNQGYSGQGYSGRQNYSNQGDRSGYQKRNYQSANNAGYNKRTGGNYNNSGYNNYNRLALSFIARL